MDQPMLVEGATLTPSTSDAQHSKQDEEVTLAASDVFDGQQELSKADYAFLLRCIIERSDGKLQDEFMDMRRAIKLIRENPKLESALKKSWRTKDYKEIRESKLLTIPKPDKDEPVEQKKVTENAWTTQYRGEAPAALWTRIKMDMNQAGRYARYLAIVQSSGTGKSRMIEELGKTHFVIPINLRGPFETGYPPPDKSVREYLTGTTSQKEARIHAVAFLRAVFNEASKLISELREPLPKGIDCHDQIVDLFSKYMSEGMKWGLHGDKRRSFYAKVESSATKLEGGIKELFAKNESSLENQLASVGICEAFKELIETLSSVRMRSRPHQHQADQEPLVILAFDEARTLARPPNDEPWSHFSELRRALRVLNNVPLFSLFLTTSGNVNAIVPSSNKDLSSRMQSQVLSSTHPFAEVGFDHFAFKDRFDLREVMSDEHISHFGRPLWATRYDEGNDIIKSRIIQFAALKLRSGRTYRPGDQLSDMEKLACLAQRLPIEFHSVTYGSKLNEIQLVEGHMRILLKLDAGFESLATVSASEPLLSEAAYWMMTSDVTFKAAETLKSCLDGYSIHKGDRGELLVMLLFTLARDRAIGNPDEYGWPYSRRRWCSVLDFMSALFKSKRPSLKTLFANSKIFFNHWVKVHQYAMVNVQYLAQLMRRGAALLCATNQIGIDGIIPFLLTGYTISLNNIGVILWQVKNDSNFNDNPQPSLFEAMDPYALGILKSGDDIPIIRIVFALASKTPCHKRVISKQDGFKSCDIWVGGISPTVFSPVDISDASIWMALLQATYGWEDIYKKNPEGKANSLEEGLRRSMNPGTAIDNRHWGKWANFTALSKMSMDED